MEHREVHSNANLHNSKLKDDKHRKSSEIRKDSQKSTKSEGEKTRRRDSLVNKEPKEEESNVINAGRDGAQTKTVNSVSPKVPRKFINNWRQACDRTKDRTKELLKKWRTLPEQGQLDLEVSGASISDEGGGGSSGWSEHVWTTWVKRFPSGDDSVDPSSLPINLTETQRAKYASFFTHLLDMDRDDVISLSDFEAFTERLRHFADWSKTSTEYHRLREVQQGFVEAFLKPDTKETPIHSYELLEKILMKEQVSLEEWLRKWGQLLQNGSNFLELPLWLQYFPKILFTVINRSGTGLITQDELSEFYSSIVGLNTSQVTAFIDDAYRMFTSNGDHGLTYKVYRLCFANFILAQHPNGPGQYLLGPTPQTKTACFPIDYKALSCAPQDLEQYSPELKTNRRSVVV